MQIHKIYNIIILIFLFHNGIHSAEEEFFISDRYEKLEEQLKEAESLVSLGKWEEIVALYNKILEDDKLFTKNRDSLVKTNNYLYRNVREVVWENLQKSSIELLKTYRDMISTKAETLYKEEGRSKYIVNKFLHTELGENSLVEICDSHILREEYDEAIRYLLIYLNYISRDYDDAHIWGRLAFCYFAMRDIQSLENIVATVKQKAQRKKIKVEGVKQSLTKYVYSLHNTLKKSHITNSKNGNIAGNTLRRNFVNNSFSFPPLKLYTSTMLKPAPREIDNAHYINEPRRNQHGPYQNYPVLADNLLFINNGKSIFAYELPSLTVKWEYDGLIKEIKSDWHEQVINSVTYHDGAIYANIEGFSEQKKEVWNIYLIKKILAERRLVKLDAQTGRVLWIVKEEKQQPSSSDKLEPSFENKISFMQSPIILGNKVIVGGTEMSGLFNSYVLALDVDTGKTIWSKLVGSAHQELNLFGRPVRETVGSAISSAHGKIYYLTNLGAVVCLEPENGDISWVHTYDRIELEKPKDALFHTIYRETGWYNSPPILWGDYIYIAPIDSNYLYCINAWSGKRMWKKPRMSYHHYLLTVCNKKVFVSGNGNISVYNAETGDTVKSLAIVPDEIVGFGTVVDDKLYCPGKQYLYTLDTNLLTLSKNIWPNANGLYNVVPGHLIATEEILVTVSKTNISTFFDFSSLEKKYFKSMRASSQNPLTYIKLGDLYSRFHNNQEAVLKKAEQYYAQARDLIGNLEVRQKHYKLLQINQKLLHTYRELASIYKNNNQNEKAYAYYKKVLALTKDKYVTIPMWLELFEYSKNQRNVKDALFCLETLRSEYGSEKYTFPQTNETLLMDVYTIILAARYYEELQEIPKAIDDYQNLILQHPNEKYEGNTCYQYSFSRIASLIRRYGRSVYHKYDEKASIIYNASKNFDAMEDILLNYPNSYVAPKASIYLANNFIDKGLFDKATEHLNNHVYKYSDDSNIQQAYYFLIKCYENKELYSSSLSLLHTMERKFTGKIIQVDAKDIEVSQYVRTSLLKSPYNEMAPSPIKSVNIDFNSFIKREVSLRQYDYAKFIEQKGVKPKEYEHLLFFSTKGPNSDSVIYCYDTTKYDHIWGKPILWPIRGITFIEKNLVVWNNDEIFYVDMATGKTIWQSKTSSSIVELYVMNNKIYTMSCSKEKRICTITAIEHTEGKLVWEQNFEASTSLETLPEAIVCNDFFIVSIVYPARLFIIDINNGKIKKEFNDIRLHKKHYFFPVLLNDNHLAIVRQNKYIECYRIPTLEKIWEVEDDNIEKVGLQGNDQYISWVTDKNLVVADLISGNKKWVQAKSSKKTYIQKVMFDFNVVYFIEKRNPNSEWYLWCYDLDNPSIMWNAFLGRKLSFTDITITQNYIICINNVWSRGNRSTLLIFDKTSGKLLKDYPVSNGDRGSTPASFDIVKNDIWLLKDKNIWVIGK